MIILCVGTYYSRDSNIAKKRHDIVYSQKTVVDISKKVRYR